MSTHSTTLRRRVRRTAAVAAGVATLGGSVVVSFPATASAKAPQATMGNATIMVVHNKTWGNLLAMSNGDTVYRFVPDKKNHSSCTGKCAKVWPPVELASDQKSPIGKGVKGLGTIKRAGGAKQVTYKGVPLYRFVGDKKPYQVKGNIKDKFGQWWTVNPAKPKAIPTAAKTAKGGSNSQGNQSPSTQPPSTSGSNSSSGGAAF